MVNVPTIQGACVYQEEWEEFSQQAFLDWAEVSENTITEVRWYRNNDSTTDDATDISTNVGPEVTVISLFNSEGEVSFAIGRTVDYVGGEI